jgi:Transposase DDE domain
LRPIFKSLFFKAQRAKLLNKFSFLNNKYLLPMDGTGYFFSDDVHCDSCMKKVTETKDGKFITSYYHQVLCGSIVKPGFNKVIPLYPEPIRKQPGEEVNDSEINAAHRFIKNFREDHPKLDVIVVADALHANGPFIKLLKMLNLDFILSIKPGSHDKLFEAVGRWKTLKEMQIKVFEEEIGDKIKKKVIHEFQYKNNVLLNHADTNLAVNFVEYWETTQWVNKDGELKEEKRHFSWVTSLELKESNLMEIMRGGRARWKIENETFNTLKNQGYEFEHNFGHGYKNLSVNFSCLMMLTFLFDQLQELGCKLSQRALEVARNKRSRLIEITKAIYMAGERGLKFIDYTQFMEVLAGENKWSLVLQPNTS